MIYEIILISNRAKALNVSQDIYRLFDGDVEVVSRNNDDYFLVVCKIGYQHKRDFCFFLLDMEIANNAKHLTTYFNWNEFQEIFLEYQWCKFMESEH